ncbi:hypothetical protein BDZ97DRAFT_1648189 [Flammula alnicola]|nr:hypothetical protein BDZ97DRAFT_1648189 [Flammula alnicola]
MDDTSPPELVASPSNIADFPVNPQGPPSPLALVQDVPEAADQARQRFAKKSCFSRFFSLSNLQRTSLSTPSPPSEESPLVQQFVASDFTPISLDNSSLVGQDIYTDRYEWAILYENQRGLTVFSTPYYSSLSLLPSDPSPFTLPHASLKRSKQPPISLDNYPLPDGNWNWVSRCWMIDMRTDTGEVQHDGFEYNWIFRRHKWRAQIGSFNAGGWVRRRRWVRLMVRPAKLKVEVADSRGASPGGGPSFRDSVVKRKSRQSMASTFPPSVSTRLTDASVDWTQINPDEVWLGEPDEDWRRCRNLVKKFARDGQKLDLWRLWFGSYHPEHKDKFLDPEEKGKKREKQWTEDEGPLPSELTAADLLSREYVSIAPRQHVVDVLRRHGQHMLHLFVFPESRVQFLKLLGQAGLLPEVNVGLGINFGSTEIEFWSYASGLGDVAGADQFLKPPASSSKASSISSEKKAESKSAASKVVEPQAETNPAA